MQTVVVILVLFTGSFLLALKALRDIELPKKVSKIVAKIKQQKLWGIILFVEDKVIHYTSSAKSAESESSAPDSSVPKPPLRT